MRYIFRPEINGSGYCNRLAASIDHCIESGGWYGPSFSVATVIMVVAGTFAVKTFTLPPRGAFDDGNPVLKRALLVLLCLVFGTELGYKICSLQVLYLLNPCHVITMVEVGVVQPWLQCEMLSFWLLHTQIYLLAATPNRVSFSVLRWD